MTNPERYALILNAVLAIAKQRGLEKPGSDVAYLCNEIIEEAIAQAEVWDIPLDEIGLQGLDPNTLLHGQGESTTAYAILEVVMRRALDEARALRKNAPLSEADHAALMAYFNILDWGKQQAEFNGLEFGDSELNAFNPYDLLKPAKPKAA